MSFNPLVGGFLFSSTGITLVAGLNWLAEPVQVPLGAILILALLPTMELSNLLKSYLDTVNPNKQDNGK